MSTCFCPVGKSARAWAAVACVALLTGSAARGAVIAHWSFDAENAGVYADETGVHDATVVTNGTGAVTSTAGRFGNAAAFNNLPGAQTTNNAYMTIPQLTELMGPEGGSFSVATWVKVPLANMTDDNTVLADWGNAPAGQNRFTYWFQIDNASNNTAGRPRFQLRQGTGNGTDIVARTIGSGNLADDQWHHVAWTWDKPLGILRTYVDGTLVETFCDDPSETTVNNADIMVSDSPVGAIARKADNNRYYTGSLDEMWVVSGVLSDQEVMNLRDTNVIPEPASLGLVAVAGWLLVCRRRRR